jgi:hypothetical protein
VLHGGMLHTSQRGTSTKFSTLYYHGSTSEVLQRTTYLVQLWIYVLVFLAAAKSIHGARARGTRARVSVNFRKFSPCMARARHARAGLTMTVTLPLGRLNL